MKKLLPVVLVVVVIPLGLVFQKILSPSIGTSAHLTEHIHTKGDDQKARVLTNQLLQLAQELKRDDASQEKFAQIAAPVKSLPMEATTTAAREKLRQVARERKAQLKQLLKDDPQAFLNNVLPQDAINKLPADIRADLEQRVTVSGKLEITMIDKFDSNISETRHELVSTENGKTRDRIIHFAADHQHNHNFRNGSIVTVQGVALDDEIAVQEGMPIQDAELAAGDLGIKIDVAPADIPVGAGAVSKKVHVILINVQGGTNSITKQQLESVFINDPNSIKKYYSETSYGAVDLVPVIYDPVTLNADFSKYTCAFGGPNESTYSQQAITQLASQGITFPVNDFKMYIFDYIGGRCGSGGMASGNEAWITQSINSTMAHELGHNFGMSHSSTGSGVYPDINEYGDNSDVMGAPFYHLPGSNAPHKIQMGWMPADRVVTVTQSGTYTISALATTTGTDPLVLKIARPNPESTYGFNNYFISYRAPIGQDTQLDASYLNKTSIHTQQSNTFLRGLLADGQTYSDTNNAITITQKSHTATTATVDIAIGIAPACIKAAPTVTVSDAQTGGPGIMRTYTVTVKSNNSAVCPPESIPLSGSILTGWTTRWLNVPYSPADGYPGNTSFSVSLGGGQSRVLQYNITPSTGIADGSYDFPIISYDTSSGTYVRKDYKATYVVFTSNVAPTAYFTTDKTSGVTPLAIAFDANTSSDAEGPIESYAWTFGDNSTGSGVTVNHTYANAGTYTASLRVTDTGGKTHSTSTVITATAPTYTLSVTAPNGNGTVAVSPQQATYTSGTKVTLTANPTAGYELKSWGGDLTGSTTPTQITITKNTTVTADFGKACGDVDGDGVLDYDATNCPSGQDVCVATLDSIVDKTTIIPKTLNYTINIDPTTNLKDISQFQISKQNVAQLQYKNSLDLAKVDAKGCFKQLDLDAVVTISDKKVKIDSNLAPEINKPATITFYNITEENPVVKRDGVVCTEPQCKVINYDRVNHTLTIEVQGFSTYEINNEGWFAALRHHITSFFK